jgi:ribonuclease R
MSPDFNKILQYFQKNPTTWYPAKHLIHHFQISMEERRALRRQFKVWVADKVLERAQGRRYRLSADKPKATEKEGLEAIIEQFELRVEFPKPVLAEAESFARPGVCEKGREDLRKIPFVTIDGETAKDFDDAVAVQELAKGVIRLWVSIADVSHYVTPGSDIDQEAYRRTSSVYFPSRCVPMLPEGLSNDLCSLVPKQDRLTMTAEMDFNTQGHCTKAKFYPSMIRSHQRLTYTEVQAMLDQKKKGFATLKIMNALCDRLRGVRKQRGSLDFDLPEPEIVLNLEEKTVESIVKAKRYKAHMMIEEFMIAANETVATFLQQNLKASIYRIHEDPDPEKIKSFREVVYNLGVGLPGRKKITSKDLAQVVEKVKGRSEERLINTLILRSLQQAQYSTQNPGHFGLASKCYTHFTSPIRRYPDLVIHRLLKQALPSASRGSDKNPQSQDGGGERRLAEMASHCSDQERVGMKAEWASRDWVVSLFMKDKVGKEYEGNISGVAKFGFFVELHDYFVQGMVPVKTLKDDYYVYDEKHHSFQGRRTRKKYKLGDRVRIRVEQVNTTKRWVDFILIS